MGSLITLFGFGEVGSLVAALVNSAFEGIHINVINTQTSENGRILDLRHAAACKGNTITHNKKELVAKSDIVVYAAGLSNVHGESRNTVAEKNKELVFQLFDAIDFVNHPTIIVITNPVEPISYWIQEITKGKCQVLGTGTALDTFRLKYILAKKFDCQTNEIETIVIGEHGQNMVPVFSHTKINGRNLNELCSDKELTAIKEELVQSAYQIRETEKATKYGIAETTLFFIRAILSDKTISIPASTGEIGEWATVFQFKSPLFISLPLSVNKNKSEPIFLDLNREEKDAFQNAIDSISKSLV